MKKQKWTRLTPENREKYIEIIGKLLDQDLSIRQISINLGICENTVKNLIVSGNLKYDFKFAKAKKRKKLWTEEKYYELYEESKQYLELGWSYAKIAKEVGVYTYRICEVVKRFCDPEKKKQTIKKIKESKNKNDKIKCMVQSTIKSNNKCSDSHSIELDSKMRWRKFNIEVRLLSCPIDKFKYRIIKCSAIQELYEYLDYFCPLNEFIIQFGDKKNEMFVFIDDIKHPLDQQTIFKLFY